MNRQIAAGGMILGSAILLSGCQVTEERQRETAYTSAISQTETEIDENLIVVGVSQDQTGELRRRIPLKSL